MKTQPTDVHHLNTRRRQWYKYGAVCILIFTPALLLTAAQHQSDANNPIMPGWIVVEKSTTGDDTRTIQAAIDSVAATGGVVMLPAGTYQHTGLTGRANVHLRGVHVKGVKLDYTPNKGDGITLEADPDHFIISDLTLSSSGRSDGWAVRADEGGHRSLRVENVTIGGFLNGILITNALNVTIRQCRIGHTYPNDPKGIGLQFGNGRDLGGNGVTVEDCYLSSLDKAIVTHAGACLISRPIIELCHTGIETHGTTTLVMPWIDGTTDVAHLNIQPNTIGGGTSGTGALLLGYGSSGWNIQYGTDTERKRTIILPERLDVSGNDGKEPRGIKLGSVVIDREGVIHAKEFKKFPERP